MPVSRYYTGIDGALYVNDTRIAKIVSWTLNSQAEVIENTTVNAAARTFVFGRQQWSGSCVAIYYDNALGTLDTQLLLANTLRTTALPATTTHTLELRLTASNVFKATVLINSSSITTQKDNSVEVNIDFMVTGLPITATMGAA